MQLKTTEEAIFALFSFPMFGLGVREKMSIPNIGGISFKDEMYNGLTPRTKSAIENEIYPEVKELFLCFIIKTTNAVFDLEQYIYKIEKNNQTSIC